MAKDFRTTRADALAHAIAAAELYMSAYKESGTQQPERKASLRRKFEELVVLAEQLKARKPTQAKSMDKKMAQEELSILNRSSDLHGNHFRPWECNPPDDQFSTSHGGGSFTCVFLCSFARFNTHERDRDSTVYAMSNLQQSMLDGWKRPALLLTARERSKESWEAALMAPDGVCDLVQDITTDCSVVASLCAAMKILLLGTSGTPVSHLGVLHPLIFDTRTDTMTDISLQLLSTLMFPFDHENKRPRVSPNGKYIFRMHFNGCFREVVVDDRLPVSKTQYGRNLFVVDRRNPDLLWPALMEKAYLSTLR